MPCERRAKEVSFEWFHRSTICLFADSKVRFTFPGSIMYSGSKKVNRWDFQNWSTFNIASYATCGKNPPKDEDCFSKTDDTLTQILLEKGIFTYQFV